jgi:hypothetical protein
MIISLYLCGGKILALKSPGQWDFYADKTGTYLWIWRVPRLLRPTVQVRPALSV